MLVTRCNWKQVQKDAHKSEKASKVVAETQKAQR